MNKNMILVLIIVILVVLFVGLYFIYRQENVNQEETENNPSLANPASTKCINEGGRLEKVLFENGEDNYCVFEDESRCFEWDFYRGTCNKGDLKIRVIKEGEGVVANKGNNVMVHYTGKLLNGTKFDSSVDRGVPFAFNLGENRVIQGWEQGVLGMKVGEKRELTISPRLGYGNVEMGPIPANSTLIFEVELLGVN